MNYWNWLNVFYTGVSNHTGGSMCNGLILRETPAETIAIDYSGIAWGVQQDCSFRDKICLLPSFAQKQN